MTDQMAMVAAVVMLAVLGVSALVLAVVFVGAMIETVLSLWPHARRSRAAPPIQSGSAAPP